MYYSLYYVLFLCNCCKFLLIINFKWKLFLQQIVPVFAKQTETQVEMKKSLHNYDVKLYSTYLKCKPIEQGFTSAKQMSL